MQEAYESVKPILDEKLDKIKFETGIKRKITCEQYPPSIRLSFSVNGFLQKEEYNRRVQEIADIVGAVAEEHKLAPYHGCYDPFDIKGSKMFKKLIFNKEFYNAFVIEPEGDPYSTHTKH